jgi:hypothetical protein
MIIGVCVWAGFAGSCGGSLTDCIVPRRDESTEDPKSYKGIDFVTDVSMLLSTTSLF